MADRSYSDRGRRDRSRQAEQFDSTDHSWRDEERDQGQMGEGWRNEDDYGRYDGDPSRARERESMRYAERSPREARYLSDHLGPAPHSRRASQGFAPFTGSEQGGSDFSQPRFRYGSRQATDARYNDYENAGYGAAPRYLYEDRYDERGFLDRASDEVASWFGDEDAARRREMDHRGRGPAGYTRSDERILEDSCDALTEDWQVDARQIQVTVKSGEVTLDGTVSSRDQKRRAEDCVEDLSGVRHVQNNLRVEEREAWDRNAGSETMRTRDTETTG